MVITTTTIVTPKAAIVKPIGPSELSYKGFNHAVIASFQIKAATKPSAATIRVRVCFLISDKTLFTKSPHFLLHSLSPNPFYSFGEVPFPSHPILGRILKAKTAEMPASTQKKTGLSMESTLRASAITSTAISKTTKI